MLAIECRSKLSRRGRDAGFPTPPAQIRYSRNRIIPES